MYTDAGYICLGVGVLIIQVWGLMKLIIVAHAQVFMPNQPTLAPPQKGYFRAKRGICNADICNGLGALNFEL